MDPRPQDYQKIVEQLHDGLYFTDRNRVITFWNKAAADMSGFGSDEVVGRPCSDNILNHVDKYGAHLCLEGCPLSATMEDGVPREGEVYMHHKDGHRIPVSVRTTPMYDDAGRIVGGIELFTDMSSHEAVEQRLEELEKLALLDELTQMPNRRFLENDLASRHQDFTDRQVPYGVLFFDIDHFKVFNDTHGHATGDEVLKLVARTLTTNARPFDVYGRWGGEEFLAVLRNIQLSELEAVGNRMRILVENSFLAVGEDRLEVTVSVGATVSGKGESIDEIVDRADEMLYQSKESGRNRVTAG